MSTHPRSAPARRRARALAERPLPIWLAVAGVGGGLGFAVAAASAGGDALETVAFLAGSAALGGLGLYGVAERWMFARAAASGMDAGRAFSATWETAPEAAALLDATGRVLALNAAARREGADGGAGPERLIPRATIARDTVFRLLNGAADGRAQRLRTALSDGARIEVTVWALGAGRYLWRWRAEEAVETGPDADRGAMAMADAGAHWCRIAADGAILETSASFERAFGLSGDGARGFDRLFPEAAAERALAPDEERVFIGARIGAGARRGALANLLYLPIGARGEAVCVAARPREALRAAEATEGGALAAHVDALGAAVAELDGGDDVFGALAAALLVRDAPVGVAALALDGVVLQANGVAARLLSGDEGGAVARAPLIDWVSPHEREDVAAQVAATRAAGGGVGPAIEVALRDASGRSREAQLYFSRVASPRGPLIICFMIDASERRGLEARYHQSQKLHAVGELAGGVAHDFNNLLTVILGACETLLERATVTDPHYGDLSAIQGSARRAATLVSQLLAYSRKQKLTPKVTDLSELIGDLSFMLDRMLGASAGAGGRARGVPVKLDLDLDESVWPTRVDVNQFEQVVTNLVVNARDAMKEQGGGRIRLSCANAQQETPRTGANFAMPAGDYVRVAVSDDGCGIPKDKLQKIFDPFFTTKPVGEGTGLGLSTVFGIVKQTGGYIFVDSAEGAGTTFEIFVPRLTERAARLLAAEEAEEAARAADRARPAPALAPPPPPRAPAALAPPVAAEPAGAAAGRVVLLVEDEAHVRALAARALQMKGLEVIEAEDAEEALEILRAPERRIDLMLSDVVMPGMDGPSLLRALGSARPELKTIFMSGYARDAFAETLESAVAADRPYGFLSKPFSLEALVAAVEAGLDGRLDAPE